MSALLRSRYGAFLLLAFVAATTNSVWARQDLRKAPQPVAPARSSDVPASAPARYFTINEVLAKGPTSGNGVQVANTSTTMTDAAPTGRNLLPSGEPFGLSTFRAPEGLLWVKWRGVEQQLQADAKEIARCKSDRKSCTPQARQFLTLVERAQARSGRERIEAVNAAVNAAIRYTTDYEQHGVADQWTAPLAALGAGRGDCEDYAIAKYAILRAAGVAASDLRLLLVRDRAVRQDHAVLAVREGDRWLVLDNRHQLLAETNMLPLFTPLFSLDHDGVSLFAAPYVARPTTGETARAASPTVEPGLLPTTTSRTRL